MITKQQAINAVCTEASEGDIVRTSSTWFWIVAVRDPSHPSAPGMVWEGYYWQHGTHMHNGFDNVPYQPGYWGPLCTWHVHDGCAFVPVIMSKDDVAALDFPGV